MNCLGRVLPSATEVCEQLRKLNSSECKWTWNNTYQNLYYRAKNIIKKNVTIVFYNEKEQLYLEMDALGVELGAGLVSVRDRMWFPRNEAPQSAALKPVAFDSKSLISMET